MSRLLEEGSLIASVDKLQRKTPGLGGEKNTRIIVLRNVLHPEPLQGFLAVGEHADCFPVLGQRGLRLD